MTLTVSQPVPRVYCPSLLAGLKICVLLSVMTLTGCGPSGTSGGADANAECNLTLEDLNGIGEVPPECRYLLPDPDSSLSPRIFILGSEITPDGKLHIYVNGVDQDELPLELADFQTSTTVTVDGTVRLENGVDMNGGGVVVQAVADGSQISLATLTDYSASMSDAGLVEIGQIYASVLSALPAGFEAQVLNFSNFTDVRQDWTEDFQTLLAAVQYDPGFAPRFNTAFYDGIGNTLYRPDQLPGAGLSNRCRAMRIFISHTDGLENASFTYSKNDLIAEIDASRSIAIMLGTVTADIQELQDFAGSRGAFVYAYDLDGISAALDGWVDSLGNIVEFVIEADSFNPAVPGEVRIALGALSVTEVAPYELDCIP